MVTLETCPWRYHRSFGPVCIPTVRPGRASLHLRPAIAALGAHVSAPTFSGGDGCASPLPATPPGMDPCGLSIGVDMRSCCIKSAGCRKATVPSWGQRQPVSGEPLLPTALRSPGAGGAHPPGLPTACASVGSPMVPGAHCRIETSQAKASLVLITAAPLPKVASPMCPGTPPGFIWVQRPQPLTGFALALLPPACQSVPSKGWRWVFRAADETGDGSRSGTFCRESRGAACLRRKRTPGPCSEGRPGFRNLPRALGSRVPTHGAQAAQAESTRVCRPPPLVGRKHGGGSQRTATLFRLPRPELQVKPLLG